MSLSLPLPLLATLDRARAALAELDVTAHSPTTCADLTEALAALERACATARILAAARAAEADAHRDRGFHRAADWLSRVIGTTAGDAERSLTAGQRLADMPETRAAAIQGLLSLAQLDEITSTTAECPTSEQEMLKAASCESLKALRERGRAVRQRAIAIDDLQCRQRAARSARHWVDELGMVRITAALTPDVGIPLVNRLDAETDRRRRRASRTTDTHEARDHHAADALASMLTAGNGTGRSNRADVVYVCDIAARSRGHAHADEACHIIGGGRVAVATVVDAERSGGFVKAVLHDGVRVATVAHYGRHIPAEVRTALMLGGPPGFDGLRCCEPGCDRRYQLEIDHVDPLANGGATALANLAARCKPHHWEKSEQDRKRGRWVAGRRAPP
jgi:hypothetical protein